MNRERVISGCTQAHTCTDNYATDQCLCVSIKHPGRFESTPLSMYSTIIITEYSRRPFPGQFTDREKLQSQTLNPLTQFIPSSGETAVMQPFDTKGRNSQKQSILDV